ncbi:MAG: Glycosyl transferase group 1 [Parcubacteria group bacterium GW2011_GWA2_47_16]|nr:MAG: Glycosyl transferase group 1 [Parcubacteria group bacterium GW2011_GWA2_47_16]
MKVLSIGSDRKLFEEGSSVRQRAIEYAGLFEELHIVVFSSKKLEAKSLQLTANCWVYSTNSWSRWFYIWGAIRIGKRIIRDSKFSIHDSVTAQDPFECGFAAYKIARRFKFPLHIQVHTDFLSPYFASLSLLNRIRVHIARRVLPQAKAIRVVSQRIKNSLIQDLRFKIKDSKITVLPIWTDLKKFTAGIPSFDLKQKYPEWSFIIVAVGRYSPEKNFTFAIEVLKQLVKKYPKTGLVMVGEGPLRGELERAVWRAGLYEHVAFEPWQTDLTSYYKTANLFIQTSLYEGFGLALLEAVASGCLAVSSDVGVAPELLNHKGHSFVCSVNDIECFVRTISGLVEDNQLRTFFSLDVAPSVIVPFLVTKENYLTAYKESIKSALG